MKKNAKKLSLSKKISIITIAINVVIYICISYIMVNNIISDYNRGQEKLKTIEKEELKAYKKEIKEAVSLAYKAVEKVAEMSDDKELSQEIVRNMKYGDDGKMYIWIHKYNEDVTMVMHPKKSLEGLPFKNITGLTRVKKLYYKGDIINADSEIVTEIKKNINIYHLADTNQMLKKDPNSEAYAEFYWTKPGMPEDTGYKKISYNKLFKKWGWVIGSGLYIDDIERHVSIVEKEIAREMRNSIVKYSLILILLLTINIIGIIILKRNLNPINTLTTALKEISKGNLRFKVKESMKTNDEVGEMISATEKMANNMANLIQTIKVSSENVADLSYKLSDNANQTKETSTQISTAITNVAEGAGKQVFNINTAIELMEKMLKLIKKVENSAISQTEKLTETVQKAKATDEEMQNLSKSAANELNSINETASLVSLMAEAINQVTTEATNVSQNSQETAETAQKGEIIVTKTVKGMEKIKDAVLNSSEKIDTLGKRSSQIGDIIEVIDDIAEQTNLLALNAAIEAARAGEHGKGFAVVADEVRKLAERSSTATKEIATLIQAIQTDTKEAVESMKTGTDEVEKGAELAYQTKKALKNILAAISETVDQIQNITASTEEIAASSGTVVQNISNIEVIIKNNTEKISQVAENSTQIVSTTQNVMNESKNNQQATIKIKTSYEEINSSIDNVSAIAEDTSSLAEEVTASTEEMTATMETTADQTESLSSMAKTLLSEINKFNV